MQIWNQCGEPRKIFGIYGKRNNRKRGRKIATGIDYLSDLGVNYIHLLPAQDFVNNEASNDYNWGYSNEELFRTGGKL